MLMMKRTVIQLITSEAAIILACKATGRGSQGDGFGRIGADLVVLRVVGATALVAASRVGDCWCVQGCHFAAMCGMEGAEGYIIYFGKLLGRILAPARPLFCLYRGVCTACNCVAHV